MITFKGGLGWFGFYERDAQHFFFLIQSQLFGLILNVK